LSSVFSWGWEHEDSLVRSGTSIVEVDLQPVAEGTWVLLRHHKLEGESASQHAVGRLHYLERLRVAAGGGDPGADPGPTVGRSRPETP
jgi:hypothetical protein